MDASRAQAEAQSGGRLQRHALADRLFHWIMAASVLTLLVTAFGPILGWKFEWVTIHWIAGLVLTAAVLFHIVRAIFWLDLWTMMPDRADLIDTWRSALLLLGRSGTPAPGKPGKFVVGQKLYHWGMAGWLLTLIATGLLMLVKQDTPFWNRNPYWLTSFEWGVIYVIHGLFAMAAITLIIMHVYFAVRPSEIFLLRSMIVGWITRKNYLDHSDPQRWKPEAAGE